MAFYQSKGEIPKTKHTTFYQKDNKSLYREELVSTKGFSGIYSTKYHIHIPPAVKDIKEITPNDLKLWDYAPLQNFHFFSHQNPKKGNFWSSRQYFLRNDYIDISVAFITDQSDQFYENAKAHELIFIHQGKGEYRSDYGVLKLEKGDYLIIPKTTIGQFQFDPTEELILFVVESKFPFEIPSHYRNEYGQLLEHAPYSERDFKLPQFQDPTDEKGDFLLNLKYGNRFFQYILEHHPFDVVGWDGYLYPYTFNIKDYMPKVGKIHLPPPVHLLFHCHQFVVCNFVPRLFDFHPNSIPAPYNHSNIDSDEVIYYVEGDFMSRKGIERGSITLHPGGIPHGPQPGKTEASIGKKETLEYAIMIDTFSSLNLTTDARDQRDKNYYQSWL